MWRIVLSLEARRAKSFFIRLRLVVHCGVLSRERVRELILLAEILERVSMVSELIISVQALFKRVRPRQPVHFVVRADLVKLDMMRLVEAHLRKLIVA